MKIAWRLNEHKEFILGKLPLGLLGRTAHDSPPGPRFTTASSRTRKDAKTLIKKLQAANFADLVAEVERLGF